MTRRSERAGVFSERRKLSKYESALESAYRQKHFYEASPNDTSKLTILPDVVIVPDQDNSSTAIELPETYFDEDKIVEVINKDTGEDVTVGGVSCPSLETAFIRFDGSSWVLLYSVSHA